jgi:hypothetical protein
MKIPACYRFKHRIYHTSRLIVLFRHRFQLALNIQYRIACSSPAFSPLAVIAQWVKVLMGLLFVPMRRAWEGPSSNQEPTDHFVIWPMFMLFFPSIQSFIFRWWSDFYFVTGTRSQKPWDKNVAQTPWDNLTLPLPPQKWNPTKFWYNSFKGVAHQSINESNN